MRKQSVVSAVVPAYNEEKRIERTLKALRRVKELDEIIVVDDGSTDATAQVARRNADSVVQLPRNIGKGGALSQGMSYAAGNIILFVDADLMEHAKLCGALLSPVLKQEADMTIARFPAARKKGGFG